MRDKVDKQRRINAMAAIINSEGFHYIKEECSAIVEAYFRGYRNAETQKERYRCVDDAFVIERAWKQMLRRFEVIKSKVKET